jgi:plastocyanin
MSSEDGMGIRSIAGRLAVVLAVVALLGAACGNDANPDAGRTSSAASSGASASTGGSGSGSGYGRYGGSGGGGGGSGDGTGGADIQANNFAFDPMDLAVRSGAEIALRNGNANTPHTFTIDGTDVDVELEPLATEDVTIDLDPGTYDFHCRIHPQMTGTLTVT